MAVLVPETGTGADPGANCYIDVAGCDLYHADRGNAAWASAANTAAKEAAILKAADYLDYAYEWVGERLDGDQPMQWPRDVWGVDPSFVNTSIDVNTVPKEVVKANAELALLALTGDLMPAQTGGKVTSESVSVAGAVSKSKTYAGGGADTTSRRFPFVDRIVAKYASGGSSGVRGQIIERG